jgi:hypothetical protein
MTGEAELLNHARSFSLRQDARQASAMGNAISRRLRQFETRIAAIEAYLLADDPKKAGKYIKICEPRKLQINPVARALAAAKPVAQQKIRLPQESILDHKKLGLLSKIKFGLKKPIIRNQE